MRDLPVTSGRTEQQLANEESLFAVAAILIGLIAIAWMLGAL